MSLAKESIVPIAEGLAHLRDLQRLALIRFNQLDNEKETLATYGLALQIEVSEFVNELKWKPWKHKEPNMARVVDEFVDVIHFIGTWVALLEVMGVDAETIAEAFASKYDENQRRFDGQVEGYAAPKPVRDRNAGLTQLRFVE